MTAKEMIAELDKRIQKAEKEEEKYRNAHPSFSNNVQFYIGLSTGLDIARAMLKASIKKEGS